MNRRSSLLTLASATTLAAGTFVVTASPALAADYTPACGGTNSVTITGNTFTFAVAGSCDELQWGSGSGTTASDYSVTINGTPVTEVTYHAISSGNTVVFTYSGSVSSQPSLTFFGNSRNKYDEYFIDVSAGGSSSSPASSGAPTPVVQSFGKPGTGTCDEAASENLNWSGVASGGWGESWGQWEGYTGPVCTRTLVYSTSRGGWVIN